MLRITGLSKTFPGTTALSDVDLDIRQGEVHALVGQNGSGKSTLIKILAGFHAPDPGAGIWVEDEPLDAAGNHEHELLRFVHQDLGLILELGVMDNLALHAQFIRGPLGTVSWKQQARAARELLGRFDLDLDLKRPLSEATPVQRVIVAIVAALQGWERGRGILVLDEPTAVLPPHEVEALVDIVAEVKRTGTSIVYVSHRMDEIFRLADRVTVLRSGKVVETCNVSEVTPRELASLMAGEDVDPEYRAQAPQSGAQEVALEATGLTSRYLRGTDITVHRGEIVGLAGLPGSGREDLPYLLAGALGSEASGQIRVPSVGDAFFDVAQVGRLGMPLIPADRAHEGVIADFSVKENLSLPVLGRLRRGSVALDGGRERRAVSDWTEKLRVKTAGIDAGIATLSGGNQQKVLMARSLAQEPDFLLLCEPTAGVDIHTRIAIYDLLAQQARQGLTILVSSTDIDDLLAICTRVLVFRDGVITRELDYAQLTHNNILHAMEGTD